ncbi:MAG: hypothetical protein U1E10_06235 [Bdellovibrionales bacterium]|nr:hypothetical protein [Bdellovibrionales bacterium]
MKIALLLCSFLFWSAAEAGPRFLNANLNSKTVGSYLVSVKVGELPLPIEAKPETIASIDRDNGQIVAMNCVTTAKFADVAVMDLRLLGPSAPVFQNRVSLDVVLANSYAMQSETESCNASPLNDLTSASLASQSWNFVVPMKAGNESVFLSLSVLPFSPQLDVTVSGDENRLSLDWVDLFTPSFSRKATLNFSVYKQDGGTVSYLEHGTAEFDLH